MGSLGVSVSTTSPSQESAMEMADTNPKKIQVDVVNGSSSPALPMHSKLAHVLAVLVSGVIALAVATVLADGTSVVKLKAVRNLPRVTNPELISKGIDYRLDELLGPTYGIGLHHDQSGRSWTEIGAGSTAAELVHNLRIEVVAAALPSVIATDGLKHPVPLLSCNKLKSAGLAACSLGFIAEIVAVGMILFHSLVLIGMVPAKLGKMFASLIWLVLSIGFLSVTMIAVGVYTTEWTCDNVIIPTLRVSDHFEFSYGYYFAITGLISAWLIFVLMTLVTSTTDGEPGVPVTKPSVPKIGATLVVGIVLSIVFNISVAADNDGFKSYEIDPNVNYCHGQKPKNAGPGDHYFDNVKCFEDSVTQTLEQAGANVTFGFKGLMHAGDRVPITTEYSEAGLCPVNVHWHLGAEHLSMGEYDQTGTGPINPYAHVSADGYAKNKSSHLFSSGYGRQLAGATVPDDVRLGHRCHKYDANDTMFTTAYNFQYCEHMVVGETYEIHWPHSAAGACGSKWQYQTPFYDGVFCKDGIITIAPLNTYEKIGVQSQVFTIVNSNDPQYQNDNLMAGAWTGGNRWTDVAKYTGSTTGTSRDNYVCSRYTPVTWQVDRKCHLISAASFDKLCKDMKDNHDVHGGDDMSGDFYAHGSRITVAAELTANNQQSRK